MTVVKFFRIVSSTVIIIVKHGIAFWPSFSFAFCMLNPQPLPDMKVEFMIEFAMTLSSKSLTHYQLEVRNNLSCALQIGLNQ